MRTCALLVSAWLLAFAAVAGSTQSRADRSTERYLDSSGGQDWPGYGRTFGEQHYSPLTQIDQTNISRLGLAWSMDLGPENSATQPIAVDGVLYFATGLSIVQAVDAASGKLLWRYDPQAGKQAGIRLRLGWGIRGIAWWDGRIYTGTQDGRLIAIEAKTGRPLWSVQTLNPGDTAYISGAPCVFDGKVIIGFGSDIGKSRGYVTAYDSQSGRQLWRFYTVPGNPADGFENKAMEAAAKTWAGEWWKFGGGGMVWNAMAYDPETDTVYVGTGGGYPANRRIRSADQGDNLFIASVVALDGKTGAYKWHYQVNPGDSWDYDATMDIELADLVIGGKLRKVLMQAPKNGFYYVIDRLTGELISAAPLVKVTWATHVDLKTGRPVETPQARYPNGVPAAISPSNVFGAHNRTAMAYSPKSGLAYIPVVESVQIKSDKGIDPNQWRPPTDGTVDLGEGEDETIQLDPSGALVAWNPLTQKKVWEISYPTYINGGLLATAGALVFQGTIDGAFKAYASVSGKVLWSFSAKAPLAAAPISYSVHGKQYVTVLTGLGVGIHAGASYFLGERGVDSYGLDPRSQARRVLTFALGGKSVLPATVSPAPPPADPDFKVDAPYATAGEALYRRHCGIFCHGEGVIASIHAPDLRRSAVPLNADSFATVVRDGGLVSHGMPAFGEFTDHELATLRQYIRTEAEKLRKRTVTNKEDVPSQ